MTDRNNSSLESGIDPSRIIYSDTQCLVVNKLAGEAVEGASAGMADLPLMLQRSMDDGSLPLPENISRNSAGRLLPPAAVHRLDVPVTGCAIFALTRDALVFLNKTFNGSESGSSAVEKHYWAIIEQPRTEIPPAARLLHWLYHDTRQNKSIAYNEPGPQRKKAELAYRICGAGKNYLFLEIQLFTGRHHQIRSQLAAAGLRIKGDLKYGARRSEAGGGIRLHARSVSFPDPSGSGCISVQAAPPVMDNLWQAFSAAE